MKTGKEIEQEYSQQFADNKPEITPMHELIDMAMQEAIEEQNYKTRYECCQTVLRYKDKSDDVISRVDLANSCLTVKAT